VWQGECFRDVQQGKRWRQQVVNWFSKVTEGSNFIWAHLFIKTDTHPYTSLGTDRMDIYCVCTRVHNVEQNQSLMWDVSNALAFCQHFWAGEVLYHIPYHNIPYEHGNLKQTLLQKSLWWASALTCRWNYYPDCQLASTFIHSAAHFEWSFIIGTRTGVGLWVLGVGGCWVAGGCVLPRCDTNSKSKSPSPEHRA